MIMVATFTHLHRPDLHCGADLSDVEAEVATTDERVVIAAKDERWSQLNRIEL